MANPNFGNKIMIRKLQDGTILVFYDKRSIYAIKSGSIIVFHRWFSSIGEYYSNFRPLSEFLKRRKGLSWFDLIRSCARYGVDYSIGKKIPARKNREVVFISEKGGWGRKLNEDFYDEKTKREILREIGYEQKRDDI